MTSPSNPPRAMRALSTPSLMLLMFLWLLQTSCGQTNGDPALPPALPPPRTPDCANSIVGETSLLPTIEILVAEAGLISGRVNNTNTCHNKVVLYAETDLFYIQPLRSSPFTNIEADGQCINTTHRWDRIVALLVDESYIPIDISLEHPSLSDGVLAYDEFPIRCTSGIVGDPKLPPEVKITDAQASQISGTANNIDTREIRVVMWAKTNIFWIQAWVSIPTRKFVTPALGQTPHIPGAASSPCSPMRPTNLEQPEITTHLRTQA